MYPLKTLLINCTDTLLPSLRQALHNHPAVCEAEFAKAADAIDNCRWTQDESRLLIFHLRGIGDMEDLQRLKRTFNTWPILALVDSTDSRAANLLLLANRAGAAQVVPFPLDEEDFRLAMDAIGGDHGETTANAKMIAVSGVTGGCGGTTVALNLAYQIATRHKLNTVLTEMAFQKGVLGTYLNVEPKYGLQDLLGHGAKMDLHIVEQAVTKIVDHFGILAGPHHQILQMEVSPIDVQRLLDYLRRVCSVVVLDVPCTHDDLYVQTLSAADQVMLVAEQSLPSLRSLRLVLDMLGRDNLSEAPFDNKPVHLVVNRYNYKSEEYNLAKLEELLQVPRLLTVGNDYGAVNAAVNAGQPLKLKAPRSRVVHDLDKIVDVLMATPEEAKAAQQAAGKTPGRWGLLGRLARAFGLPA